MASDTRKRQEKITKSNWKFFSSMEKLEELFGRFENYMIHGAPVNDKFGHNHLISYRVRPQQTTIHSKIIELLPDGWFSSKSDFHRKKDMIGTECMLNLLISRDIVEPKAIDKYGEFLKRMNVIAQKIHEDELNKEYDDLVFRMGNSGNKKASEFVNELKELKEHIVEFNHERSIK